MGRLLTAGPEWLHAMCRRMTWAAPPLTTWSLPLTTMNLYLLRPVNYVPNRVHHIEGCNPWDPWYDKAFGFVVRAEDETQARQLADANSGGEGTECEAPEYRHPWLKPDLSICEVLAELTCSECLAETPSGPAEVLLTDFKMA